MLLGYWFIRIVSIRLSLFYFIVIFLLPLFEIFIYFLLSWVVIAASRLSLVVSGQATLIEEHQF